MRTIFPTVIVVSILSWSASHIIIAISILIVWILCLFRFARNGFSFNFWNAMILSKVVYKSINLNETKTISVASVRSNLGVWTRLLKVLSLFTPSFFLLHLCFSLLLSELKDFFSVLLHPFPALVDS